METKNRIRWLCVKCLKKSLFGTKKDIADSQKLQDKKMLICWSCGFDSSMERKNEKENK